MKVVGFDELQKKLRKNVKLADVKKIVVMNGSQLTENSQKLAPVDTGNLKRSITMLTKDNGMATRTKAHVDYAAYVEYGTRFQGKKPYMKPAYSKQKVKFIKDLERLMK
ncbi:HK97-gp10 family putative phage morphogenesis protein [Lactococcus formosensis]|uniref:HK97-gp10 family putative phage morphogenesis protein n=1 Tax=Lactococcus formosensis TaxID=1281486 RepID=UPI00243575D6|nr:HK97-gp10 family putative phage morphogenesis protein [Lactococcus formosensis]MDG6125100.1 HK97 gp10 family phage protein [Lactococcus formosensis]MDG6148798.1 HK97 gp10 family phage protein [Lactococcus formosensis]